MNLPRYHVYRAYLIVICDQNTNAIEGVTIWSSPEWEQSCCLPGKNVFIAYAMEGESYAQAKDDLMRAIAFKRSRYHYLYEKMDPREQPRKAAFPPWEMASGTPPPLSPLATG